MAAMAPDESSEARMKADIAAIRDDVASIAGRPKRMLKFVAIVAAVGVIGFLLLAVIGMFVGPPDYRQIHDEAYSGCMARGGTIEGCQQAALRVEAEAMARDDPKMRPYVDK